MGKQNRKRLIDTEDRLMVTRGEEGWGGMGEKGEGTEKCRLGAVMGV